jgi:hypothetical protein
LHDQPAVALAPAVSLSTVAIEYRWAEGRSERYAEIAVEFVRLTFSGRAESFLMARLEFGLSDFLFGSLPAFCGSEHYAFLGDPTFSQAAAAIHPVAPSRSTPASSRFADSFAS